MLVTPNNLLKFCIKQDLKLEIWDINSAKLMKIGHDVFCCAFSPNDRYLVSGSKQDSTIKIWGLENGKQFGKTINLEYIQCLTFSFDSLSFSSSTSDGYIYQWEVQTQNQLLKINNFNDCIIPIYSIGINCILTLQSDKLVKLWNLQNQTFQLIYNHKDRETVEKFDYINLQKHNIRSKDYQHLTLDTTLYERELTAISQSKIQAIMSTDQYLEIIYPYPDKSIESVIIKENAKK